MIKITLIKGTKNTEILLDKYKIFIGNNYYKKFDIMQMFRSLNHSKSEYAKENNEEVYLMINDELVGSKSYIIYEVNSFFNFDVDLKLGTKSLSYLFLLSKLMDEIHVDVFNTINLLLESLQNDINDNLKSVRVSFDELNPKSLLKLSSLSLIKEDMVNDSCDLSFEDFIIQQLLLLYDISKDSLIPMFVLIDVPIITDKILRFITLFENVYFLIFTNEYPEISEIKNVYMIDEVSIDFADEQLVYEIYGEKGGNLFTMEEVKAYLFNCINKKEEKVRFIKEMLQQR